MDDFMVSNMAVLGSCATRDLFNSQINPNYKEYFKIITSAERTSIISLMSNPIHIEDKESINVYSNGHFDFFGTKTVELDLTKKFLFELKNNDIDYLIIDNLFEARFGILSSNEGVMTNNSWDLHKTEFYKNLKNVNPISMSSNSKKYLKLYKKNFNLFYDYINNECGDINIILNKSCDNEKYVDNDGSIKINDMEYCIKTNPHIYQLNKVIEDNFDVDIVELNISFYPNDVNHCWGIGTSHFIPEYYRDFTKKLNKLIHLNKIQNKNNEKIFYLQSKLINLKNPIDKNGGRCNLDLTKYITARLDLKNEGNRDNKIEFLSIDNDVKIEFPNWFKDENGVGVVIQCSKGELDLNIRCRGNGKLNIRLMGIDVKHEGKRIPIFINFKSLIINGNQFLDTDKLVSHDDYYYCGLNVKDGDFIFIHAEWSPF